MIFRQLIDAKSSTYTYLLAGDSTKEGVIIDPVIENIERDIQFIDDLGIKLKYSIETHVHADHVTSAHFLRERTGCETVFSKESSVDCSDILVDDEDTLAFGNHSIQVITTPGHTNTCICLYIESEKVLFTGDTLLIRGCGRTDFQSGSAPQLFESIRGKLFSLPDETLVYPGHDYKGRTCSSIFEEKSFNPRVNMNKTLEEFTEIMDNLKLPSPKQIDIAVPANMKCGQK